MIQFRCWYCNRLYSVSEQRIGERITCPCRRLMRVPKRSGGYCRVRASVDWVVETIVYGFGGGALGFGLALMMSSPWAGLVRPRYTLLLFLSLTGVGFLAGLFGGERGINWIGQMLRDRENRR